MNLSLNQDASGEMILAIHGELDATGCAELRPELDKLPQQIEGNDLVVDLSDVSFLDSSGIGAIVFLFKRVRASGAAMALSGARGQPLELLELLRIHSAIPVRWTTGADQ